MADFPVNGSWYNENGPTESAPGGGGSSPPDYGTGPGGFPYTAPPRPRPYSPPGFGGIPQVPPDWLNSLLAQMQGGGAGGSVGAPAGGSDVLSMLLPHLQDAVQRGLAARNIGANPFGGGEGVRFGGYVPNLASGIPPMTFTPVQAPVPATPYTAAQLSNSMGLGGYV